MSEAGDAFVRAYDLTPIRRRRFSTTPGSRLLMGQQAEQSLTTLEKLLTDHRQDAELDWYQALISAGIQADQPARVQPFVDRMLADYRRRCRKPGSCPISSRPGRKITARPPSA